MLTDRMKGLVVLFAALVVAGSASGHSKKEATVPADGAVVASVESIEMRFDSPMLITAVTLSTQGDEVDLDRGAEMKPSTHFRAAPDGTLDPGIYTLDWRGLSTDGHPMQGSFSFTVGD